MKEIEGKPNEVLTENASLRSKVLKIKIELSKKFKNYTKEKSQAKLAILRLIKLHEALRKSLPRKLLEAVSYEEALHEALKKLLDAAGEFKQVVKEEWTAMSFLAKRGSEKQRYFLLESFPHPTSK